MRFVSRYGSSVSRYVAFVSQYAGFVLRYVALVSRYGSSVSQYVALVSRYGGFVSRYVGFVLCYVRPASPGVWVKRKNASPNHRGDRRVVWSVLVGTRSEKRFHGRVPNNATTSC